MIKQIYQNISSKLIDAENGEVQVHNKYNFQNTNNFEIRWELLEDGRIVESGNINSPDRAKWFRPDKNSLQYIFPQETGNKTDVRWVVFSDENRKGIRISGLPEIDVTATPYLPSMIESATHNYQLSKMPFYTIQVDYKQRGVGGNNSWGLKPLNKYRLLDDYYEYSFLISPVN